MDFPCATTLTTLIGVDKTSLLGGCIAATSFAHSYELVGVLMQHVPETIVFSVHNTYQVDNNHSHNQLDKNKLESINKRQHISYASSKPEQTKHVVIVIDTAHDICNGDEREHAEEIERIMKHNEDMRTLVYQGRHLCVTIIFHVNHLPPNFRYNVRYVY